MRLTRTSIVAAMIVGSIVLTMAPASAAFPTGRWGFSTIPVNVPPGASAYLEVAPQALWNQLELAEGARRDAIIALIRAATFEQYGCQPRVRPRTTELAVLDPQGRVVARSFAADAGVSPWSLLVPDGTAAGTYFGRVRCRLYELRRLGGVGAGTPILVIGPSVTACIEFRVDPSQPLRERTASGPTSRTADDASGGGLGVSTCPGVGRALVNLTMFAAASHVLAHLEDFRVGLGTIPEGFQGPETTTTVPSPGNGSADTIAPVVSSVSSSGSTYCQAVNVSASVSDAVGVTSATVQWGGAPGSGSMAMSGAGASWSAVIDPPAGFANPGVLNVTVTARDAAGNQGTGSSSIELTLC